MDYASFPTVPVLLERSSLEQRWGFRLQGGADFRLPLSVKKVRCQFDRFSRIFFLFEQLKITPNSPSHNKLHAGDAFAFIDGLDAGTMNHEQAEQLIGKALRLQVILRRYVGNESNLTATDQEKINAFLL